MKIGGEWRGCRTHTEKIDASIDAQFASHEDMPHKNDPSPKPLVCIVHAKVQTYSEPSLLIFCFFTLVKATFYSFGALNRSCILEGKKNEKGRASQTPQKSRQNTQC